MGKCVEIYHRSGRELFFCDRRTARREGESSSAGMKGTENREEKKTAFRTRLGRIGTLFCCKEKRYPQKDNWRLPWGSRTVKTVPSASLLVTDICPRWDWTMALAMARPSP